MLQHGVPTTTTTTAAVATVSAAARSASRRSPAAARVERSSRSPLHVVARARRRPRRSQFDNANANANVNANASAPATATATCCSISAVGRASPAPAERCSSRLRLRLEHSSGSRAAGRSRRAGHPATLSARLRRGRRSRRVSCGCGVRRALVQQRVAADVDVARAELFEQRGLVALPGDAARAYCTGAREVP